MELDFNSLVSATKNLLQPKVTEDDIKAMAEAHGAKTPQEIAFVLSVFDNESSGGKNLDAYRARIVGNGSTISGPMQVMTKAATAGKSTFDMFAAPGKTDPNNPYHTSEAGVRYALEALKRAGGDVGLAFKKYQAGLNFDGKSTRSDGLSTTDEYANKGILSMSKRLGLPVPGQVATASSDGSVKLTTSNQGFKEVQDALSLAVEQARTQAGTNTKVLDTFGMNIEGANQMLAQMAGRMQASAQRMETARAARSFGENSTFGDRLKAMLRAPAAEEAEKQALSDFANAAKMVKEFQDVASTQIRLQSATVPADAKLLEAQGKLSIQADKQALAEQQAQLRNDIALQRQAVAESQLLLSQQQLQLRERQVAVVEERLKAQLEGRLGNKPTDKGGITADAVVEAGKLVGLQLPPGTTLKDAEKLLKGDAQNWGRLREALIRTGAQKESEIPLAGTLIGAVTADVDPENTSLAAVTTKQKIRKIWTDASASPAVLQQVTGEKVTPARATEKVAEILKDKTAKGRLEVATENQLRTGLVSLSRGDVNNEFAAQYINSVDNPYVPTSAQMKTYVDALSKKDPKYAIIGGALKSFLGTQQRPEDFYLTVYNSSLGVLSEPGKRPDIAAVAKVASEYLASLRNLHVAEGEFVKHNVPVPKGTYVRSPTGTSDTLNLENPEHFRMWALMKAGSSGGLSAKIVSSIGSLFQ